MVKSTILTELTTFVQTKIFANTGMPFSALVYIAIFIIAIFIIPDYFYVLFLALFTIFAKA